jgi:hypothetical protein
MKNVGTLRFLHGIDIVSTTYIPIIISEENYVNADKNTDMSISIIMRENNII